MNSISVEVIFPIPVTDMILTEFKFSCITVKEVVYIIVSASLFYSISVLNVECCVALASFRSHLINLEFPDQESKITYSGEERCAAPVDQTLMVQSFVFLPVHSAFDVANIGLTSL